MVTTATKAAIEAGVGLAGSAVPSAPSEQNAPPHCGRELRPSGGDALQALLAFSALHQQVRQRRMLASRYAGFDKVGFKPQFATNELQSGDFEPSELFVLDEVLQLVAERAIAITGADGLAIALAENNEIILRASAGEIKLDVGARIERDSSFSGACFRTARIIRCDDTETDDRVNRSACRQLGARSMVAVPLCGRRRVIGLVEAFSAEPFGFNDHDIDSLELLAELVVGALKPEDEDRFAESAKAAEVELAAPSIALASLPGGENPPSETIAAPASPVQDQTEETSAAKAPPLAEPDSLQAWDARAGAEHDAAEAVAQAVAQERSSSHPGMVLVLVLVVVATLLAAGLWWKLKNAQLGSVMLQPTRKTASPLGARAKRQAAPATPRPADSSSFPISSPSVVGPSNSQLASGTAADAGIPAEATKEGATTQELSHMPHVTGIRQWSSADSSTVVLDLEDQVQYEAHRLSGPDRIYFDLHDTAVAPEIAGKTIDVGDALLARVRLAQPVSGMTRVVLETKGNSNYSVSLEPNPYRLVVRVRKLGVDNKSQVNLFPGAEQAEKLAIVVPPPTKEDLQLRARVAKMRIVVDAGHGGWDLGTVGRRGLLEKDLVLEIAQRLGKLLQSRLGADVILTRNDDNYIPLDERAAMANQSQADLFVSVHANYSDLPSARGVETYYTSFFSAPNSKDIESRQSSTDSKNAATVAVSGGDLHDRIEQSRRLAASVQRSLYGTLSVQNPGLRDRGVKEASYVVLTETAMPGILAEVSFVSSPADEQKLRSDGYREQIAEALYKGIARYAANSHPVKMASITK
jgi:N-acetylmuramoyl-L-alanine amidase/putative methionine-R-sulfoxide reductase with GAF domain